MKNVSAKCRRLLGIMNLHSSLADRLHRTLMIAICTRRQAFLQYTAAPQAGLLQDNATVHIDLAGCVAVSFAPAPAQAGKFPGHGNEKFIVPSFVQTPRSSRTATSTAEF